MGSRTAELIEKKLHELNFNINTEVVERIHAMFRAHMHALPAGAAEEYVLNQFIQELVSSNALVELQAEAGVNDDEEFHQLWRTLRRPAVRSENVSPETFHLHHYPKDEATVHFLDSVLVGDIPFGLLTPEQKRKLVGSMTPTAVESGTVVIQEGGFGSQMYIVESGELEVSKGDAVLRILTRGSLFGEIALLHNIPRTATVKAMTDSRIWVVEQTAFSGIRMMDRISNRKKALEGLREHNVFPSLSDEDLRLVLNALTFTYYEEGSLVKVPENEFFMALHAGWVDDGEERDVQARSILHSDFVAVTAVHGTHIRNRQRTGSSRFSAE